MYECTGKKLIIYAVAIYSIGKSIVTKQCKINTEFKKTYYIYSQTLGNKSEFNTD